jgi:succinate-semialdehyde dehydrogenase / glutarate-semialdehyde dehydrogenase
VVPSDTRGEIIEVRNPATGELVGHVEVAGAGDVKDAVARARQAQARWKARPFGDRAAIIRRFHDIVLERCSLILDTIQSETGKARRDALGEVITVAGTARYYLAHGSQHLAVRRRRAAVPFITSAEIVYKPHGVVGLITPWNYPFILSVADALPAFLAGNAVVLKPSELTPLTAVLSRNLLIESGMDPDLFAIVHGGGDIGSELIQHVDYIGFTGGTATGTRVAVAASQRLIPYSLELGGKNAMLVLSGTSIDNAVSGLVSGAFSNSGQTCIAVERVFVEDAIFEKFAERLIETTSRIKLGWSKSWDIDMGSLISAPHAQKVMGRIGQAIQGGARVLAGGRNRLDLGSNFVEPTVLTDVSDAMPISREETFGPVITLQRVSGAEEAVRRANDSNFGLNASVWAGDTRRAIEIARQLETGSTGINSTLLIYNSFDVPMGGIKQSGIGRRHGEHGILRYTQAQSIVRSIAAGGGYDSLLLRFKNEKIAKATVAALKLWRRIPWVK